MKLSRLIGPSQSDLAIYPLIGFVTDRVMDVVTARSKDQALTTQHDPGAIWTSRAQLQKSLHEGSLFGLEA